MAAIGLGVAAPADAQIVRASTAAGGVQATGSSREPVLDAEGLRIYFASNASDLVPNDTNNSWDVFEKNLETGAIRRVSLASDGMEREGDSGFEGIDVDNRTLVFTSRAALMPSDVNTCDAPTGGTGPSCPDIYSVDLNTGTVDILTLGANGPSRHPRRSGDRTVFESDATNLTFAVDTNNATDVFMKQGITVTRLSLTDGGLQAAGPSFKPAIADDEIVFLSDAANLSSVPDPRPCPSGAAANMPCTRAYLWRATSGLERIDVNVAGRTNFAGRVTDVEVNDTMFALSILYPPSLPSLLVLARADVFYRDPVPPHAIRWAFEAPAGDSLALGGPGLATAILAFSDGSALGNNQSFLHVFDIGWQQVEALPVGAFGNSSNHDIFLARRLGSHNIYGGYVAFSTTNDTLVPGDTNAASDVFRYNRDVDADGMPSYWEDLFGLNRNDATDVVGDPDNDGVSNGSEFSQHGHPFGMFKYYLAEGAANAFFTTRLSILNPDATLQPKYLARFLSSEDEAQIIGLVPPPVMFGSLTPMFRTAITLGGNALRFSSFSTVVESDHPLVVDRTMFWDSTGFGAHAETATTTLSNTWYLAEGATHGAFDLFYLLQNAGASDTTATITYLRPAPAPPVIRQYPMPARSRRTIWVDQEGPELADTDVSAIITGVTGQNVVERSMYMTAAGVPFAAGHNGIGLTAPATRWFLAEGATGNFFDLFVLIANPDQTNAAELTVTYLLPNNQSFTKPYSVPALSRRTISVDGEDPRLENTPVSMIVESTNGTPVLVERSQWWPSPNWYEGHLAAGTTTTGTKWAMADGQLGGPQEVQTYILIANTSTTNGSATVTLVLDSGVKLTTSVLLDASSRVNFPVADFFPDANGHAFSAIVESNGVQIVVERAMYWNANGQTWAAGTAAVATKLQ